ncbi:hypothetical protein [Lentzea sp. NBRC 102530]|nr:hypothetical protein [Lentzea sp. NBRC 102530]
MTFTVALLSELGTRLAHSAHPVPQQDLTISPSRILARAAS